MFLFFQDMPDIGTMTQFGFGGVVIFLVGYIVLKIIPSFTALRMKELDIRAEEHKTQLKVAEAIGGLGNALNHLGTVTHDIAIEQRKATENTKIMQRVNANESNQLANIVELLTERMDSLEDTLKENGYETRPKAVKSPRS